MTHSSISDSNRYINISIHAQTLSLYEQDKPVREYRVSSALNGTGEQNGSGCTPRGQHKIRLKIGQDCAINTVFKGRRPTGEVFSQQLASVFPERDWILTRIIWLTGAEHGFNRGGEVDTLRRYIYLHGCPDSEPMGQPQSHGCIRMRNEDIMELFELVENNMPVIINE